MPSVVIICLRAICRGERMEEEGRKMGFTFQIDPQIVGVEDLEFTNLGEHISLLTNNEYSRHFTGLEIFDML